MSLRNVKISSGSITEKGNLTGFTGKGVRIHVFVKQLALKGLPADFFRDAEVPETDATGKLTGKMLKVKALAKPLFAIVDMDYVVKNKVNPDGTAIVRPTATGIFDSMDALVAEYTDESGIDESIAAKITASATARGLNADQASALVAKATF